MLENEKGAQVGRPLPRAAEATIAVAKLRDYALNPEHDRGGADKARVFRAALGFERNDWAELREQLRTGLRLAAVRRIREGRGLVATTYEVLIPVRGREGRVGLVTTAWKLVDGVPALVTAYVDVDRLDAPSSRR